MSIHAMDRTNTIKIKHYVTVYWICLLTYTGHFRRNFLHSGKTFLMLNYIDTKKYKKST
jgi:hypothetical protein